MTKGSILYIYNQSSIGVDFKVNETIKSFEAKGFPTNLVNTINNKGLINLIWKLRCIITTKSNIILIRSFNSFNIFLIPYFAIARIQGKKLILDTPTPLKSYICETINNSKKKTKWGYVLLTYINGPWVNWFFNLIIQYGDESNFFMFGNKHRTMLLGNGIDPNRFRLRESKPMWPNDKLITVAVAHPNFYHGFDRVIKAISLWNKDSNNKYKIEFNIIGDSDYVKNLKELVFSMKLEDYVIFHKNMDINSIYSFYNESHIAISSLGLFRVKLNTASVLKAREYCLVGIPFIASGKDPDFSEDLNFRFEIKNDESLDEILTIFKTLPDHINNIDNKDIRNYAIKNLTFESKLSLILKKIQ